MDDSNAKDWPALQPQAETDRAFRDKINKEMLEPAPRIEAPIVLTKDCPVPAKPGPFFLFVMWGVLSNTQAEILSPAVQITASFHT